VTRSTLKTLLVIGVAVPFVAGAPATHAAPPASEEYVFEGPNAGGDEGAADSGSGSVSNTAGSGGSDAAVPILIGVLVATAAAGVAIAIVRRQRA
jgi:hypothetical protein